MGFGKDAIEFALSVGALLELHDLLRVLFFLCGENLLPSLCLCGELFFRIYFFGGAAIDKFAFTS